MPFGRKFGEDLPKLRDGSLDELRNGAAESSETFLRARGIPSASGDIGRLKLLEAAYESLKSTPGFDPNVAGSASFKLKW